jgi:chromosome segregation ATPase
MSDELKSVLRAVLKEELSPINKRLNSLEAGLSDFKNEMHDFKQDMYDFKQEMHDFQNEMNEFRQDSSKFQSDMNDFRKEVQTELQILKGGQKGIRNEITDRFNEIKSSLSNLESHKPHA